LKKSLVHAFCPSGSVTECNAESSNQDHTDLKKITRANKVKI